MDKDKIPQTSVQQDKDMCFTFTKLSLQQHDRNQAAGEESEVKGKEVTSSTTGDDNSDTSNEESSDDGPQATYYKTLPTTIVNENKIAEYRAKLYRFDTELKQWKEKGIGKIMILQSDVEYSKCRVVMWAEATGRVACNFSLFPELQVSSYQQRLTILCWKAFDFSDPEEPKWETFTCRFVSETECKDFKAKVLQYANKPIPLPIIPSSTNEKSDCSGCVGCDPDKYEFRPPSLIKQQIKEPIIECPLGPDSCKDLPSLVKPTMFKC